MTGKEPLKNVHVKSNLANRRRWRDTPPEAATHALILTQQDIMVLKSVSIWSAAREPPQTTSSPSGDISWRSRNHQPDHVNPNRGLGGPQWRQHPGAFGGRMESAPLI